MRPFSLEVDMQVERIGLLLFWRCPLLGGLLFCITRLNVPFLSIELALI